jgi:hypothetical protein
MRGEISKKTHFPAEKQRFLVVARIRVCNKLHTLRATPYR